MYQLWPPEHAGRRLSEDELEQLYVYPGDSQWLAVNFVSSADGAVHFGGQARPLSTPPDRTILQLGNDLADVLLVGATTAMVEGFRSVHPDQSAIERRRRHGLADTPVTAVVTTGNLPGEAPVITEAQVPTLVLTCTTAPQAARQAWAEAGAEVILTGEYAVDLAVAVQKLIDRGLCRINCEGGPHLFGALLAAGLVNELRLTLSPLLTAGEAGRIAASRMPLDAPAELHLSSVLGAEDTLMLRYLVDHEVHR